MSVTVRAAAKFNLHLGVGAVRDDGFHPLATVYHAIGLYDDVSVSDADRWEVVVTAEDRIAVHEVPTGDDNIVVRAGRALTEHHGIGNAARIAIHKGIPVAGGLAGGSADAAATLVALDRLWSLQTSDDDLLSLAAELGSDVPFALVGATAIGRGRGEIVAPVADNGAWWWVAVGNEQGLSTPSVYRAFDELTRGGSGDPEVPEPLLAALEKGDVELLAEALANDLQAPALALRPDLAQTFADAEEAGALAVQLSGSGPTVLLLCRDATHAREVAGAMQALDHPRVWTAPGPVAGAHVITY
ncbi:4-diphosphocytidyl-2-C-methyl-D-erythritol kinase [Nocardioides albertanoniae]|uniref:4-diphosphocytidyl-2-C-methyl-D-erythritol kinase n=1 Tax=Nocardioides albertanoniae TaxID=1175486 RepID=A0A543ACN6_9ACTN|nr:4-(cytidine 5'-diphospho)-2-C-methyl-D-erythritol kinase [Nocardioides albertanoniae]TQL70343.1 4-diphosphocytidyl-2-C-methyl-D-erythritol kinase [Nocardioides albertanoniae]